MKLNVLSIFLVPVICFSALFSSPWRQLILDKERDQEYLRHYTPGDVECEHIRILLYGPVGAGKSCFINSVGSALRGKIVQIAADDSNSAGSYSNKYKTHRFPKGGRKAYYSFVISDMMGIEQQANRGICVEDIKLAMMGHVNDGYEFKPEMTMSTLSERYNPNPTIDDKAHVLVCILPANSVALVPDDVFDKIREVRLAARDLEIPQLALLTKIDVADPSINKNIHNANSSRTLKEKVEYVSAKLGFPENCILLVKNYSSQFYVDDDVDALILSVVRQMVSHGVEFLYNI